MKNNVKSILKSVGKDNKVKDKLKCVHNTSNKVWKSLGTLTVKRYGDGRAFKTVREKCALCSATRVRKVDFTDTRIIRSI